MHNKILQKHTKSKLNIKKLSDFTYNFLNIFCDHKLLRCWCVTTQLRLGWRIYTSSWTVSTNDFGISFIISKCCTYSLTLIYSLTSTNLDTHFPMLYQLKKRIFFSRNVQPRILFQNIMPIISGYWFIKYWQYL